MLLHSRGVPYQRGDTVGFGAINTTVNNPRLAQLELAVLLCHASSPCLSPHFLGSLRNFIRRALGRLQATHACNQSTFFYFMLHCVMFGCVLEADSAVPGAAVPPYTTRYDPKTVSPFCSAKAVGRGCCQAQP